MHLVRHRRSSSKALTICLLGLAGLAFLRFQNGTTLWCFLGLRYMPMAWFFVLLGGAAAALLLLWWPQRDPGCSYSNRLSPLGFDLAAAALSVTAFVWLRAQTHFLGDGYLLLSNLAKTDPLVKDREAAVMTVLTAVRQIFGSPSSDSALSAYRTVAILSGVVLVILVLLLARRMVESENDRRLFVSLWLTSGSMLLFFGYVENYALLQLGVGAYGLLGLLGATERLKRWLAVPVAAFGLAMHPVAIFLLPSLAYLVAPRSLRNRLESAPVWILIAGIVFCTAIGYAWSQTLSGSWFHIRFALLPIIRDGFTVDGYTLMSPFHLMDMANLALVLCAGWVLLILARGGKAQPHAGRTYVLLLLVPALLLAFLLDPKLGMPRDWDLLAFAVPPLLLGVWYLLIQPRLQVAGFRFAVWAVVVLQGLLLLSRAGTLASPEAGVEQAQAHFKHAPGRSRTGWTVLSLYRQNQGDSLACRLLEERRPLRYPEEQLSRSAQKLIEQGEFAKGKSAALATLRHNPRVFEAWVNLGRALRHEGKLDSSLRCMQVAAGLNPYSVITTVELGMALARTGDLEGAETTWLKSLTIDSSHFITYGALAELYGARQDSANQISCLERGMTRPDAESWAALSLGEHYAQRGQFAKLGELLELSRSRGFDTAVSRRLQGFLKASDP